MKNTKFYICPVCGNLVEVIEPSGVPLVCCGKPMQELVPGTVEASHEKHIPVPSVEGRTVKVNVGSVDHPMVAEHYIPWVALETEKGAFIQWLQPEDAPEVVFALAEGQTAKAVYAYCNLHGLWKADI